MSYELIIEIIGAVIGLSYIYLQYKANFWLWTAGIIMSLFYIYIFAESHLYFWAATYLYYLCADIYGIIMWKRNDQGNENPYANMKTMNKKMIINISLIIIILSTILSIFAKKLIPESPIPVGESISTILSIVAMWLLAKKYIEQWLLWIIVNIFYAALNFSIGLYPTGILFSIYFMVAIMGYLKWRKGMKQYQETPHQH